MFADKELVFTFSLGKGQFGADGSNEVTVSNLRATIHVENAGGAQLCTANMRIYGLTQQVTNQLATLGFVPQTYRINQVTVTAQDGGGNPTLVFNGTIQDAYVDYDQMPETPFVINAYTGMLELVKPGQVIAATGSIAVADLLEDLAGQFTPKLTFENNGVTATLSNPYYTGSIRQQVRKIIEAAGIDWNGGQNGTLAIWLPGSFRNTEMIPTVSPATGMINYPAFNSVGLSVRTLFNPAIVFGGKVQINTSISSLLAAAASSNAAAVPANSDTTAFPTIWGVAKLNYDLECQTPGGKWEMSFTAAPVGYVIAST